MHTGACSCTVHSYEHSYALTVFEHAHEHAPTGTANSYEHSLNILLFKVCQ